MSRTSAPQPRNDAGPPPRRKDAQRNREAILRAARDLFAEAGGVPMYEIARRAGVGQATLYRHFPDRAAVALALFQEQLDRLTRVADDHAGDPEALFVLLREVVAVQVEFHGLIDGLREEAGASPYQALKDQFVDLVRTPLRDAKKAGRLRRDASLDDVFLAIAMVAGALEKRPGPSRAVVGERALGIVLDGLATPAGRSA